MTTRKQLLPLNMGGNQVLGATGLRGSAGITALYAAIANRNNARCDIVVIGDSITEGQGATAFTNRWVTQANRAIRAAYPTTVSGASGGLGFIPIQSSGETSYTWPVTLASGSPGVFDLGPVRACADITGTTSFTWTAPPGTTSVQIMYYDAGFSGSFTWKIGSGSTTTVTNASGLVDLLTASIPISGGQVLTIAWASGEVLLDGIVHYAGDEASGITFHGCGHYGWSTTDWLGAEDDGLNWQQCYSVLNPVAVAIMLGVNDASTSAGNLSAATFGSNLASLISGIRGGATTLAALPLLLIAPYAASETYNDAGGWPAYVAAARAVAGADTVGAHMIDLSYPLPTVASSWHSGALYADTVHPSDLGHVVAAEIVAAGVRIA
jgi:lysophospholipase L1-like esterase